MRLAKHSRPASAAAPRPGPEDIPAALPGPVPTHQPDGRARTSLALREFESALARLERDIKDFCRDASGETGER